MNYADIKKVDVANGPGVRVSLFVSGCTHRCEECFNPETWDFGFGSPFGEAEMEKILDAGSHPEEAKTAEEKREDSCETGGEEGEAVCREGRKK